MALWERLCVVTGCVACCLPFPAQAANAEEEAAASEPPSEDVLERVIVTARRRFEALQEAPVSVVSLSASELETRSVNNIGSLQNFVPNLTFAPSQNVGDSAGNVFIRGIGQEDFLAGTEPGVGFYLDGVYVARTMGMLIHLVDIERVEVLRGPQGTLYGKNAIGGAINVISTRPGPEAEAKASLIGGNLGRFDLRGMVNAPLTDRFFLRLAAGRMSRDGYLKRRDAPFPPTAFTGTNHNDEGRDDIWVGRLQLRWEATPSLILDLAGDVSRRRGTQAATHVDAIDPRFGILPEVNRLIREGKLPGPEVTNALATGDWLTSYASGNNLIDQDIEGVAATLGKNLGDHRVTLVAAYRSLRSHVQTDLDGTWFQILGTDFRERHRQYSAELQAGGMLGRVKYTAGLFALAERMRTSSGQGISRADVRHLCDCLYPPDARPVLTFPSRKQNGESYATFAQASLPLVARLSATLGGRFSYEKKSTDVQLLQLDPDSFEPTDIVRGSGSNEGSWTSFTWRAGLEFQANPELMLYASAAKGYKSGGFNTRPVANLPNLGVNQFAPETAITYEAGARSEWAGGRLRLNATVFHTDYRDIQLRQQMHINGVLTTLIDNAARARIRGIEIEAAARLGDRLSANLAYGHANPRFLDVGTVPGLTLESEFQRTPHHSLTASLEYSLPIGRNRLILHGDYSYRSSEQFQLIASPFDQSGYGLLGARAMLHGPDERWSVALFGTNLADKRYRAAGRGTGLTDVGIANAIIGQPRHVGVEIKAGF